MIKVSVSNDKEENLLNYNLVKLNVNKSNAPDIIKKYHNQFLAELKML